MSSVSILYAPKDEALGEKIAAALASAGLHASHPQDSQADQSETNDGKAGAQDGAAIVVWTEAAAKLVQLHEHAMSAMARGALVPVAVGGVSPPDEFESLPPVDLSGWTGSSDDPRWRFVLEEIQLTTQRLGQHQKLHDGVAWKAAENQSGHALEQNRELAKEETQDDLAIAAQLNRALPSYAGRRSVQAPTPVPPPGSPRRRFSAKEVAIGAAAGLVVMTVATALLAPILLPSPKATPGIAASPEGEAATAQIPDPSEETASALASLSVSAPKTSTELNAELDVGGDVPPTDEASNDTVVSVPAAPVLEGAATDTDAIKDLIVAVNAETADEPGLDAGVSSPEPVAGQAVVGDAFKTNTFKDCPECPEMASLPAGAFQMGAAPGETAKAKSESPRRQVTITKSFALGTREVTFAQWDACVADGGCSTAPPDHGWGRGERPVVSVSYDDALSYVGWLSKKTGQPYRLPSEAEWEYAARAGSDTAFATGAGISTAQANYNGQFPYRGAKQTFRERTMPVASFPANAFGLFDMHGNAWEWTADCWKASHMGAPADQSPIADGDCARRVLKGGAWNTGAWRLRSAHRIGKAKTAREFDNGFRVAKDLGS